jgi:TolB-like protein/tetratricopeptide (TPR) repeat protein
VAQPRLTPIQHSAIRAQLEKILAHGLFARSDRMARFLRLAVDWTIEGKAGELKEYLIGVEVFDRSASYDPRVDPIVRVEARRLRSKLKAYYEGDGCNDPVIFEFPAGGYAPQIRESNHRPPNAPPAVNTVAVLPFANLSACADNDYFSDGLTEELTHALTKLEGMRVVAWNSAVRLRGAELDIPEVRRQLQVANVLTGSVRISGTSLRVRAQLIDTATGVYLWSETFDRQMQDVFAIQEEIATNIVRTLRVQLTGGAEKALASHSRTSVSSYDYYLKGRYHWHRRAPDDLVFSRKYFQLAIEADGNSALPHAGLADAYVLMVEYGLVHPAEGIPQAKAAASRAIQLDPNLAEAYPSLALLRSHSDGEWEDAEALYRKAIALNPGYATAHHWLGGDCLAMVGRFEEGAQEIEIALGLDPLSSILYEGRAFIRLLKGEYEEAVRGCREILEFDPTFYKAYTSMGRAYAQMGKYVDALSMLEKGRTLAGDMPNILAAMGQVFGLSGDHAAARGVLAQLEARALEVYIPSTCFAVVHLGLGEKERALDWLEKGCGQRELTLAVLKVHPVYDSLSAEPRFQALLKRLGLG